MLSYRLCVRVAPESQISENMSTINNLRVMLQHISQDALEETYSHKFNLRNGLTKKAIYDSFLHNVGLVLDQMEEKYSDSEVTDRIVLPYVIATHISFETGQQIEDVEKYIDFVWETYDKWNAYYTDIAQKHNPSLDVNAEAAAKTQIEIMDILKDSNF